MPVNIADLVVAASPMSAKLEFRDGIYLHLKFVSRSKVQLLFKTCTYSKYNPTSRKREETVRPDKFAEELCKLAVDGWEGVTPRRLSSLVPVDLSKLTEAQKDEDIPFTQEGLMALVKECWELDSFIQDNCVDAKVFSPDHEDELKNSEPSQSGS